MKTYKIKTETNGEKVKYYLRAKSKYDAYRQAYEKELWIWEKKLLTTMVGYVNI